MKEYELKTDHIGLEGNRRKAGTQVQKFGQSHIFWRSNPGRSCKGIGTSTWNCQNADSNRYWNIANMDEGLNIQEFLDSGVLELYVSGVLPEAEAREVTELAGKYPAILEAIFED